MIVGCDVEALYPSMDREQVAKIVEQAVLESNILWKDLDYLEGARFIALNKSEEWCRQSSLSKILPRRRSKTGTRPSVRGKGPMGREVGDQETVEVSRCEAV